MRIDSPISNNASITGSFSGSFNGIGNFTGLTADSVEYANILNTPAGIVSGSASQARTQIGSAIGTDVQAHDATLDTLASLTATDNGVIVGNGSDFVVESGATLRTSLGLGSMAIKNSIDISSDTNLAVGTGITLTGDTLTSNDSAIDHDALSNFVPNEHIDWTADQGDTNLHTGNYVNTTYTVQDGELSEINFTSADNTKLDGIEASADVTDTANVKSSLNASLGGSATFGDSSDTITFPGSITVAGTTTTNNVAVIETANGVIFEGTTADAFETTLDAIDPTADRAIRLPDATGTIALTSDIITDNNQIANSAGYITSFTNTTYTVQDGELSEINFTSADNTKLDGIEASADVTDTTNVTAAGALMDSEVTDLAGVKGVTISTLQVKPSEGAFVNGDKTKLDNIEASADVTDATNVTAAGALMDSEVTDLAGVKAVTISTLQVKPSEGAFVNGDKTKLDNIEASADVTDATNVTAAGALMDSEVTDLAGVKGVTISTLQVKPSEGAFVNGDKTKLDNIEASADVTDTANVKSSLNASLGGTATVGDASDTISIPGNLTVAGVTKTNNVEVISTSNGVLFEGATDDGFETTLDAIDPTADRAIRLPDADGTVALTSDIITDNNQIANSAGYITSFTNTTYTVQDGELSEINFTSADNTKLDNIEASADVTDATNVTAAGALMDSEVTDLAGVKAVTISTLQVKPSEGAFVNGDKTKLDNIEASADVNLTAAQTRTLVGTGNAGVIPTIGTAGHFLKHDGTFGLPSYTTNTDTQNTAAQIRTKIGSGNNGHVPTIGTAGHFLKHDGTFGLPSYTTNTDTTYTEGNSGLVPAEGTVGHFLKHDGTFGLPSYTTNTDTQNTAAQIRTKIGSGNNGHVPTEGTAGHFLKHDGTFGLPSYTTNTDTTYTEGNSGLVPAQGTSGHFLKHDGTFGLPSYTTNTDTNDDVSIANLKTRLAGGFASNAVQIGDSGDTVTIPGSLVVTGTTTTNNVQTVSTSNGVVFEGNAADANEVTLLAATVSADRTITLPDATGTVALTSQLASVGDGGLTTKNFTAALKTKLDEIEASADVNLTAAQTRTLVGTGNAGVIPTIGTAGHFLKHDGTFGLPSYTTNTDTTYTEGNSGLVPAQGTDGHFLKHDGTFGLPSYTTNTNTQNSAAEIRTKIGSGNNGHVPTEGTAGHFLKHDGTFGLPSYTTNTDTTYSEGNSGLVPSEGTAGHFLKHDGTFGLPSYTTNTNTHRAIHDAPVDGATTTSISSNWAYDNARLLTNGGQSLAGSFTATGDITAYSDESLKKDVVTIEGALDKTKALRGVEFTRIADEKRSIGVIAQELETILPELVLTDSEGIKSVNYAQITGLLIEAVKELSAKVDECATNKCNCK